MSEVDPVERIARERRHDAVGWVAVAFLLLLLTSAVLWLSAENSEVERDLLVQQQRIDESAREEARDEEVVAALQAQIDELARSGNPVDRQRIGEIETLLDALSTTDDPTVLIPGPQGIQGVQGIQGLRGLTGAASTVPGPQGEQGPVGPAGADSTVPGPQGATGPEGPAGPAGADSTVPGPPGENGRDGADGRDGVDGRDGRSVTDVSCAATGRRVLRGTTLSFTFTLSDGSTLTANCEVTAP